MGGRLLLVVDEAHAGSGRGVVLSPRFTPDPGTPRTLSVRLELPDGRQRTAVAELQFAHMRGPLPPFALIRLPELQPADVPAGTEVWADP